MVHTILKGGTYETRHTNRIMVQNPAFRILFRSPWVKRLSFLVLQISRSAVRAMTTAAKYAVCPVYRTFFCDSRLGKNWTWPFHQ